MHGRPQANEEYGQDIQERFQMDQTFQKLNMDNQKHNIQIQSENSVRSSEKMEVIDQMGHDGAEGVAKMHEQPTEMGDQLY